jgi:hypothetical protein
MAKNNNLTDFLTDVANAIRTKKGTTALINPQDFSSEIASIESGGGSVEENNIGYNAVVADATAVGLRNIIEVYINDGITRIGDYAFWNHSYITKMTIPDSVQYVGRNAFDNCSGLTTLVFPHNCTTINTYTFNRCAKMETITFNGNIVTISAYAFSGCTVMKAILFNGNTSVPKLANVNAFNSIPATCKIVVPDTLYDSWIATTNWSTYASYIIKKSDYDAL